MSVRKIILIDEEKCNGCGQCIIDCAEGALKIVDGKAKVIKDSLCDGLGACLGSCPEDALHIIEREADAFDEAEVEKQLAKENAKPAEHMDCGCQGSMLKTFMAPGSREAGQAGSNQAGAGQGAASDLKSELTQWPIQLRLLPPSGSLYDGKDIMLIADCVGVSFPALHSDLIKGNTIIVTCPKLDEVKDSTNRLAEIFKNPIKSITAAIMEVPCCTGLVYITKEALVEAGSELDLDIIKIGIKGDVLEKYTAK